MIPLVDQPIEATCVQTQFFRNLTLIYILIGLQHVQKPKVGVLLYLRSATCHFRSVLGGLPHYVTRKL